jgi:hypothetical protein
VLDDWHPADARSNEIQVSTTSNSIARLVLSSFSSMIFFV